MNTADISNRPPDAYDRAEKCPHCHRAMFTSIIEPFATYCPYPDCPGTQVQKKTEKKTPAKKDPSQGGTT